MRSLKPVERTEVLVVGSGFAGCLAAIEAKRQCADVLLVCAGAFLDCGSSFASSLLTHGRGCAVSLGDCGPEDTQESLIQDSLVAACGMADEELLSVVVERTPERIHELEKRGFIITRRSGQTVNGEQPDFSSHVRGVGLYHHDDTRKRMADWVRGSGVRIVENFYAFRLIRDEAGVHGAVGIDAEGDICPIEAGALVLASGGPSDIFAYSLSTPDQDGSGLAMALEAGARLVNIEFFQAIPGLCHPVKAAFPERYLSFPAELTNGEGKAFLDSISCGIDTRGLLRERSRHAPFHSHGDSKLFDIAVKNEILSGRSSPHGGVFLDLRKSIPSDLTASYFPFFKEWMIKNNIDPFREVLEIAVFTHACNGGILINAKAETDVPGLFACGEAAGGPHGANRVGGMQVASALTFGTIAGQGAAAWARGSGAAAIFDSVSGTAEAVRAALPAMRGLHDPKMLIASLRDCLWRHTCFDKTESSLCLCEEGIETIESESRLSAVDTPIDAVRFFSLRRRIEFARVLVQVQRERRESRGPHYRSDYPKTEPPFERRIVVSREKF